LLDQAISTNALNHQRGVVTDWRKYVTQKQRDNMGMEYYDEAEALFCRLDVDQKGYLTYMNLEPLARWLMKVSGINMNDMELPTFAELDEIIDMLEVVFCVHPHDGKITFDQFLLWYESIERNRMHALISRKLNFICTEIHPF
jgi:Ca2+-binding EF-hand superfamily protein